MFNFTAVRLADNDTNEKKVLYLTATSEQTANDGGQDMAETRQRSKPNRKTQRSQLHFACGRWKPSNARTTSPRPRQIHLATTQTKKIHRHTLHVRKCVSFQRNLTVENNLSAIHVASVAVETQCQRPQLSHGWPTIWVDTNRTNSNITQTRCNSMHKRIAQCSERLSHTPTARLTDSGVGQHCPKRRCRTGDHHRSSSINKQQ